ERLLHRLWCETLGLVPEAVGVADRFTDLGGTSIHAATILGRLESEYRIHVHSSVLAEHDTIAALAKHLGHRPTREHRGRGGRFSG
ncbi:MAG: acyl carrier protein, partial [Bacteroidetes bacterium]|nr:acyl carrier protein [Bacteroidota bacterium]